MPVEIEIKLKVEHLAPVRDKLRALGAKRVGEALETNIFFDTPDRALLASDCGLRLRRARDLLTHSETLILSYKGPRGEGAVKRREEIECFISPLENTIEMLPRLGYEQVLAFEKRRESWKLGRCKVELDTLPHLGSFVEIECESEHEILKLQEKLGVAEQATVVQTYADLVSHFLSDRGKDEDSLTFQPTPSSPGNPGEAG
jgi:predicted adenylyl cyclase CyaB